MRYPHTERPLILLRTLLLALLALAASSAHAAWQTPTLEDYNFHRPMISGRWMAWGERPTGSNYGVLRVFDTVTEQFYVVNVLDTPDPEDLVPDTVLLAPSTTYHPGFAFVGDTLYWSDRQPGQTTGHELRGRNLLDLVAGAPAPILSIPNDSHSIDYRFPNASGSRLAWAAYSYTWPSPTIPDHDNFGRAGIVRDLDTDTIHTLVEFTNHTNPIPDIDGPRAVWTNAIGNNTDGSPLDPSPKGIYFQLLEPDPDLPALTTDPRLLYAFSDDESPMPAVISGQHVVWSDRFNDPLDPSVYVNKLMHYDLATDQVSVLVDDLGPMVNANYALSGDILVYEVARALDPDDITTVQRDIHLMELRTPERRHAVFADSDFDESVPYVNNGAVTWYERQVFEEGVVQTIWGTRIAVPCDFNLDGLVNVQDINPFVLALADINAFQAQYAAAYALLPFIDPDGSGFVNVQDINPFIQALIFANGSTDDLSALLNLVSSTSSPSGGLIPEPAAATFLLSSLSLLILRRPRNKP